MTPPPPPEETVWEGHPSRWNWWLELSLCALLILLTLALCWTGLAKFASIPALCAAFLYAGVSFKRLSKRYRITNQRLIQQSGLFSKNSTEMEIGDIRNINLAQSLSQRLLRIGDIEIASAATDGADVNFSGIHAPEAVKERIRKARHGAHGKIDHAEPQ